MCDKSYQFKDTSCFIVLCYLKYSVVCFYISFHVYKANTRVSLRYTISFSKETLMDHKISSF